MPTTATLADMLLDPDTQPKPQVIDDSCALIEHEVHGMSGVSGTAVKLAHKTITTFLPGHVRFIVGSMLPELATQLQPYWADFSASGGERFGDYLAQRGPEVSQALLAVSDERARNSGRPVVVKAYNGVRSNAARHVEAALPQVGDLVQKYAG
jgi:hypothetical protein